MGDKPEPQVEQADLQDNEAAGLLMLFQRQSLPQQQATHDESSQPAQSETEEVKKEENAESPVATGLFKDTTEEPNQQKENQQKQQQQQQQQLAAAVTGKTPPLGEVELARNVTSPGPAAAALASSGYNKSSNIKAMVAAAALAAAAAQPMPLVSHESIKPIPSIKHEEKEEGKVEEQETEDESKENDTIESKEIDTPTNATKHKEIEEASVIPDDSKTKEAKVEVVKQEQNNEENTEQPVPYAVDPDSGIIGCICTFEHDDGFTIQCDRCFRWQHAVCMGIDNIDDAPDNYLCYLCDKSLNIDGERAKKLQTLRLQPKKRKASGHHAPKDLDSLDSTSNDSSLPSSKESRSDSNKKSDDATQDDTNTTSSPSTSKGKQPKKKGKKDYEEDDDSPVLEKHQTLYFEVDSSEYKNSSIKSLVSKLPSLIHKIPEVKEIGSLEQYKKTLLNSKLYTVKTLPESTKQKCIGMSKLGLFSTKVIAQGSNIVEMFGELDLKQNYIDEKWNQYWLFGVPKPNVFFHPRLPIVIDQRGLGNISRFVRKSCTPNCEISTFIVDDRVKFIVQSTKDIKSDTEITLPWEWDINHPIRMIDEGQSSFDSISNQDKSKLIKCVSALFDVCECANSGNDCPLTKVKKQSSHLQRSTRKFGNKSDEIQEDEYTSIDARLSRRDTIIKDNIKLNMMNEESASRESSVENGLLSEESRNSENDEEESTPAPSELSGNFSSKAPSRHLTPDSSAIMSNGTEISTGTKRKFIDTLLRVDENYLPMKYKMIKRMATDFEHQLGFKRELLSEENLDNLSIPLQIVVKEIKTDGIDKSTITSAKIPSLSPTVSNSGIPMIPDLKSISSSGNLDSIKPTTGLSALEFNSVSLANSPSNSSISATIGVTSTTTITPVEEKVEKPKVVKKFSLADYKKKAKEVKN